jgi:hypothetical protein
MKVNMKRISSPLLAALLFCITQIAPAFAEQAPDSLVVTGPSNQQVSVGQLYITLPGGTQETLASAITSPSSAISAPSFNVTGTTPGAAPITTGGYMQNGQTILQVCCNSGQILASGTGTVTLIGIGAGANLPDDEVLTTAIGYMAMNANNNPIENESTAIGWKSQSKLQDGNQNTTIGVNTLGSCVTGCYHNILIGTDSMRNSVHGAANTGQYNVGIGVNTLKDSTAFNSIAIGDGALVGNASDSASDIIAIGRNAVAGAALTTGNRIVAIGSSAALAITAANNDVFIGWQSGLAATGAFRETYVGYQTGLVATGNVHDNVLLGQSAGAGLTSGSTNTVLGSAGNNVSNACVTSGSNNTEVGFGVCVPTATSSNQLAISNLIYATGVSGTGTTVSPGRVGIGTKAPNAALTLGDAGGTNNDGHLGVLQTGTAVSTTNGALNATASDVAGTITLSAANPVVTFGHTWATAPTCVISSPTGTAFTYAVSTSTLTLTGGANTNTVSYHCVQ